VIFGMRVVVQAQVTGARYPCTRSPSGAWQCGRCTIGHIPAPPGHPPPLGAACTACHAEVVEANPSRLSRVLRVTVIVVLALLLLAVLRQWW
jgi:hypothetical protein